MENLVETIRHQLGGGAVQQMSRIVNEDEGKTRKAFETAVPMSMAGLASQASTEEGAQSLLETFRSGRYPHVEPEDLGQDTLRARLGGPDDLLQRGRPRPDVRDQAGRGARRPGQLHRGQPGVGDEVAGAGHTAGHGPGGQAGGRATSGRARSVGVSQSARKPRRRTVAGSLLGTDGDAASDGRRFGGRGHHARTAAGRDPAPGRPAPAQHPALGGGRARGPGGGAAAGDSPEPPADRTGGDGTGHRSAGRAAPPAVPQAQQPAVTQPAAPAQVETVAQGAIGPFQSAVEQGQGQLPRRFVVQGLDFESDSAVILPETAQVLDEVASVMNANPSVAIRAEGHTDATGDLNTNRALSTGRANAVKDYLVARGLPPSASPPPGSRPSSRSARMTHRKEEQPTAARRSCCCNVERVRSPGTWPLIGARAGQVSGHGGPPDRSNGHCPLS